MPDGKRPRPGSPWGAQVTSRDLPEGRKARLEILNMGEDNSGTYHAVCANAVGAAEWSEAFVTVLAPPDAKHPPESGQIIPPRRRPLVKPKIKPQGKPQAKSRKARQAKKVPTE